MRISLNKPQTPLSSQPKRTSSPPKKESRNLVKKQPPKMDKAEIRAKITAHKEKVANPNAKKIAANPEELREILKKSNFNFSAKERQVFAKILAKK